MKCSTLFQGVSQKLVNAPIEEIIQDIKSNKFKVPVDNIRDLQSKGRKEDADKKKKLLKSFTPSGTFDDGRKANKITSYSKYIILDFDNLSPDQLKDAKMKAKNVIHTYSAFISPSGNGLKILVPVTSELEQHTLAFKQVSAYYSSQLGIPIDESGKDVSRLCFMSYDPDCYINSNAIPFELDQSIGQGTPDKIDKKDVQVKYDQIADDNMIKAFERCVAYTSKKFEYINGNRNNFIHQLACNTNRAGIPEEVALSLISNAYDLGNEEIIASTKSAYNNIGDFAKYASSAKDAKSVGVDNTEKFEDVLKSTPSIPDHIFDSLPVILQSGSSVFTDKRKRDVFFTSALSIISGCLPKVHGIYSDEKLFPHLYTFIIAPAASGKGVLKNAKRLADKYHQKILSESAAAQTEYDARLAEYKAACAKVKKGDPMPEPPEKPVFKIVFIPANCSASRMIEHLQNNGGMGIICETEADNMSGAKKQDWGDYSPTLRAAFHHETITITRKTNNEYNEIPEPRLAVALSGTPAQAPRLIESAEDGLFSRFLFYAFKSDIIWQDPSPKPNGVVLNDHFSILADDMLVGISFLEDSPTTILLSESQWSALNSTFSSILDEVVAFTGEDAAAIVYRLGLITYRICMVLTALRKIENVDATEQIYCLDIDFNCAISLVKTYLQHSIIMYNNLPNSSVSGIFKKGNNKQLFLDALPGEFTTKQAAEIGKQFKLSYSTVSKILPKMVPAYFSQPKSGYYIKIKD